MHNQRWKTYIYHNNNYISSTVISLMNEQEVIIMTPCDFLYTSWCNLTALPFQNASFSICKSCSICSPRKESLMPLQSALLLILMSLATCCGIAQGEHSSEVKVVLLLTSSLIVNWAHAAVGSNASVHEPRATYIRC